MSPPLQLRVVDDVEELDALRAEWNAAADASVDANVFLTWEWLRTWWEHFGASAGLHAVTIWEGDELVAAAPLMHSRIGVGPVTGTLFQAVSHDAGDYGGIILVRREEEAVALLLAHLDEAATSRGSPVLLSRLATTSRFVENLRRQLPSRPTLTCTEVPLDGACPNIDFTARFELDKLAKKHRIPQRLRRLEERHSDVRFEHHTADLLEPGIEAFLTVHRLRWAGKTDQLQGLLADPASERFLLDAIRNLDRVGRVQLLSLSAGGRPIAVELDFEYRARLSMLKAAFDPEFAEYGPGWLLRKWAIDEALRRGITEYDFMRGGHAYKRGWANGERTLVAATLTRAGRAGQLDRQRLRVARALQRRVRSSDAKPVASTPTSRGG